MIDPGAFVHESAYVDAESEVGAGTKIWHFVHVLPGTKIGANATIVCGNTLGAYCMIAAGAVMTRDVPDYALMAGVPARRIGWVSQAGEVLDETLMCGRTGTRYYERDGCLSPEGND